MAKKGKNRSRVAAAQAATRARARAARKGWETRREHGRLKAERHGKRARQATERRLSPSQKAARTRHAHRIEAGIRHTKRSEAAKRGWATRRRHEQERTGTGRAKRHRDDYGDVSGGTAPGAGSNRIDSLDELDSYGDDYGEWDGWDVETSPDYEDS